MDFFQNDTKYIYFLDLCQEIHDGIGNSTFVTNIENIKAQFK